MIIQIDIDCKKVSWIWWAFSVCWGFSNNMCLCHKWDSWEGDLVTHQVWIFLLVVKVRFQKEKPERSHCDLVERSSPWDKGDEQCWPYSHSWKPQHRLLMTNTVFQRSSSSYQPPRQPAQEMPAYLGREFDRNQNTAYNEVRWTKEGNVDFPIQNLGHDAGDGCMWSKVLYAWK